MRGDQVAAATNDQTALATTGKNTSAEDIDRANIAVAERGIEPAPEVGSSSERQDAHLETEKKLQTQVAPVSSAVSSLISIADDEALGGPPVSNSSTGSDSKRDVQSGSPVG